MAEPVSQPPPRLVTLAILFSLAVSLYFAGKDVAGWIKRARGPRPEFELFVEEARSRIPEGARVRVDVPGGSRIHTEANFLSTRLYPRYLVYEGAADWVIELPLGEFDRSRAVIRRGSP